MNRYALLAFVVSVAGLGACASSRPSVEAVQPAPPSEVRRPEACPRCGGKDVLPIIYGRLAEPSRQRVRDGKAVFGGCIILPGNPDWACRTCDHQWFDAEDPHRRAVLEALEREMQELHDRFRAAEKPPDKK